MYLKPQNIAFIFGLVLISSSCSSPPEPEPEPVKEFDVCYKMQKSQGLPTDKCWDLL